MLTRFKLIQSLTHHFLVLPAVIPGWKLAPVRGRIYRHLRTEGAGNHGMGVGKMLGMYIYVYRESKLLCKYYVNIVIGLIV